MLRAVKPYTTEDKERIAEITRKVCYGEELDALDIQFINANMFHANTEKSFDGKRNLLTWEGTIAFSDFVAFLLSLDD